jgi:hypothetical protein
MSSNQTKQLSLRLPVVQVVGQLAPRKATPRENADDAIRTILNWLANKQGVRLPEAAYHGDSFDLDASESFPVSAVRFDEFWAVQFDRFASDVPGRIWRTEATVAYSDDIALAGVRLAVIDSMRGADFAASVPAVVSDLIANPGLFDYGLPLANFPQHATSRGDITQLIDLIRNQDRTRPVVVFSTAAGIDAFAEARIAAERLAGLAHVFVIDDSGSRALTEQFGREFSVWGGTVRTYHPNFDPSLDEISKHPLATREWLNRRFTRIENFVFALLQSFAPLTVRRGNLEEDLPAFRTIKQAGIQHQIKLLDDSKSSPREELLAKEIELLNSRLEEKTKEYDYADEEVKKAEEERDQYRAQLFSLRGLIERLENQLGESRPAIQYPTTFESIDDWVLNNFPGRLVLLNRAARAARKSPFNDPCLVYKCLERLAKQYVDARRNGGNVDNLFADLGVHIERTGDPEHLKQWKNEYFVSQRGKSIFLEWHLKRGSDKNDITTMRIYFFYDEDDEQVVVGYLPGHLTNSKS